MSTPLCCVAAEDMYHICDPNWNNNHDLNRDSRSPDGYILSPNYPSPHYSNHLCECILRTNKNSKIDVEILDFHLENDETSQCRWDFLEFLEPDEGVGSGRRLCGSKGRNLVYSGDNRLSLVFSSDDTVNTRGFWLYYYGRSKFICVTTL